MIIPTLLAIASFLPHEYDPCPCCVLETFEPVLSEGYDEDCVQAIVDYTNQQIAIARETCYNDGLEEYDTLFWDLYWCDEWFVEPDYCYANWECALKHAGCDEIAWNNLYHRLTPIQNQYANFIVVITLQSQWEIDTYCY